LEVPALVAVLTASQTVASRLYKEAAETAMQPVPLTMAERQICQPSDATISVLASLVKQHVSKLVSESDDHRARAVAEISSLFRVASINLHAVLDAGDGVHGAREARKQDLEEIRVSSGSATQENMFESSSSYWQSADSRPHWVTIRLKKGLIISAVELETYQADSYCPSKIKLEFRREGESSWMSLPGTESISVALHETPSVSGRLHQLANFENQAKRHSFSSLRLTILENHHSGSNSRVKSIKVTVAPASSEEKVPSLQTATVESVLESAREVALQVLQFRHEARSQLESSEAGGR